MLVILSLYSQDLFIFVHHLDDCCMWLAFVKKLSSFFGISQFFSFYRCGTALEACSE
jgi:hypothetical protein